MAAQEEIQQLVEKTRAMDATINEQRQPILLTKLLNYNDSLRIFGKSPFEVLVSEIIFQPKRILQFITMREGFSTYSHNEKTHRVWIAQCPI